MKINIKLSIILLATVVLSSCNREPDPVLDIAGTKNFVCGPDGGSGENGISTTYPWTASSSASWITLSTQSGEAGNSQLQYTVNASDDPEERYAYIYITTQNLHDTINVQQSQRDKITISGQKEYSIPQSGGEFSIELKSNISYKVSLSADWINRTATKAYSDRTEVFSAQPNTSYDSREAWIFFSGNGITDSIKVIQNQLDAILIPDENSIILPRKEGTFTINMSTNVDYKVSISDGTWLRAVDTKGLRDVNLMFNFSENNTHEIRITTITITGPSSLRKVFTVMQSNRNLLNIGVKSYAFISPLICGNSVTGTVSWGDGKTENYSPGIPHYYNDDSTHTISVDVSGNTSVMLNDLVGVESIDLSAF